jgi:hypothetical protein
VVEQNVPNPFDEVTRISFFIPEPGNVELKLFNSLGSLIHSEIKYYSHGSHYFDVSGNILPSSGLYYYEICTENSGAVTKVMVRR